MAVLAAFFVLLMSSMSFAKGAVRFGVPPWPGVAVKTAVVTQVLETLGYETEQAEVGPPIIYKGMQSGDMDVFLATWTPAQNDMLRPVVASGQVETAAINLSEADLGMCVPRYVWEEGVHSFADLDANREKFGGRLYNIEVGSGIHTSMSELMEADVAGLGDWEHMSSTTSMMLAEVQSAVREGDWVVFACWRPHWMNIAIEMEYLEGVKGTEKVVSKSTVYTTVRSGFAEEHPDVYRMLKQFRLSGETQSRWIYEYAHENRPADEVAREWIAGNLDEVYVWLEGVNSLDGRPAVDVVRAAFAK